jgi:hypothetical protein
MPRPQGRIGGLPTGSAAPAAASPASHSSNLAVLVIALPSLESTRRAAPQLAHVKSRGKVEASTIPDMGAARALDSEDHAGFAPRRKRWRGAQRH